LFICENLVIPYCWDLSRTNSPTSVRHEDGFEYIRILATPPRKLIFWDGNSSHSIGIRAMPRVCLPYACSRWIVGSSVSALRLFEMDCWDMSRTNSLTSVRHENDLKYIRIWGAPPKRPSLGMVPPSPSLITSKYPPHQMAAVTRDQKPQ